jgi:hypothetical protein
MIIIPPITITDEILYYSSVPEDDYDEYDESEVYSQGDRVIILDTHKIYECVIPVGQTITGISPLDPVSDTIYWIDIGWTNRWRMLNSELSERTLHTSEVTWNLVERHGILVEIQPEAIITGIALFGLRNVRHYYVQMLDELDNIVYETDRFIVDNSAVRDWWHYFFSPIIRKTEDYVIDLPSYRNTTIRVFIEADDPATAVGIAGIFFGQKDQLGCTQYGIRLGIQDFSRKTRNEFGRPVLIKRDFSKMISCDVRIERTAVDRVYRTLQSNRATPIVWIAVSNVESSLVFGFFRDYNVILADYNSQRVQLEIEGLNEP